MISLRRIEFDVEDLVTVYIYDAHYVYVRSTLASINPSTGMVQMPPNSTTVPMTLPQEEGLVPTFNMEKQIWENLPDVRFNSYYDKVTGELVLKPDPNNLDQYTTSRRIIENSIYNEELDLWIYNATDYRTELKRAVAKKYEGQEYIKNYEGNDYILNATSYDNLKMALRDLRFLGDKENQTVDYDTFPTESEGSIIFEPDERNVVVKLDLRMATELFEIFNTEKETIQNQYNEEIKQYESYTDEQIMEKEIQDIKDGLIDIPK